VNSRRPSIWLQSWHPYFILLAIIALAYGRTLSYGFTYFDDDTLILNQYQALRRLSIFWDAFHVRFLEVYFRPIVTLSLALDTYIGGPDAWIYHCSNIVFHVIACWLMFYLLQRLSVSRFFAFAASILFAVHPIVTQAVAWIPGRNDSLVTIFLMLALLAYMNFDSSGKWYWFVLQMGFAAVALLTKETALIYPGMILLYHVVLSHNVRNLRNIAGCVAAWIVLAGMWYFFRPSGIPGHIERANIVSIAASATNLRTLPEAFGKFLVPLQMSPYPTYQILPSVVGGIALVGLAWFIIAFRDREQRIRIFAVGWILLFLLPGLFVHLGDSERWFDYLESRWYGAAIGFALLGISFLSDQRLFFFPLRNKILAIGLLGFGVLTFAYTSNFSDPITHWSRAIESSPQASNAYFKMGFAVNSIKQNPFEAAIWYQRAIRLDPNVSTYHNNLGALYSQEGNRERAIEEYRIATRLDSSNLMAFANLGDNEWMNGNYDAAEMNWKQIFSTDSTFPAIEVRLAEFYVFQKRFPEARYHIARLQARGITLTTPLLEFVAKDEK